MREKMNLTDQMNQCNSDFKMLQKRIAEKIKVIKSKQRDVDRGKYSPAVTERVYKDKLKLMRQHCRKIRKKWMK